ncbi:MAG: hypothetical protein HC854_10525 [Flavobacterium sp.]|nr:hypothetical protein [Flavobacterium sp.]
MFKKIDFKPILSNIILHTNAKQTDFIDTYGNVGFSSGYLISNSFKMLLDKFNCYGFQFFKTYIIQNNLLNENYWQTNIYDFPFEQIDFKNSKFILNDRDNNRKIISEIITFKNIDDFNVITSKITYPKTISFNNVVFNKAIDLDFFSLKYSEGYKGIVSERLKNIIEMEKLTGIEFRPFELSLQEWYHNGEREKIYGNV